MANDAQDDPQKHRRSPSDDDSDKSMKRHKYRHNNYRHGSSKIEAPPATHDDVEEGEILDDDDASLNHNPDQQNLDLDNFNCSSAPVKDTKGMHSTHSRTLEKDRSDEKLTVSVSNANGVSKYQSHCKDNRWCGESVSPARLSDEKKSYHNDTGGSKLGIHQIKSSEKDELHERSRSRSYDCERSRSHSALEEEPTSKRRRYLTDKEYLRRDDERECSRYAGVDDGRHNREGESREWEVDRDRRRGNERGRSRDREIERDRRREKEGERSRDIDRQRERERYSRDREVDKDRRREKERDRSRDRGRISNRSRDSEKERGREKDRYNDRVTERRQEKRDDARRDKVRDRYETLEEMQSGRDRHRQSRNSKHDYSKDEREKVDLPVPQSSKASSSVAGKDALKRDKNEDEEDYDDTTTLQLADQEEEDLNRIKEESRRRTQAILEKYKNKQLQKTTATGHHLENAEKDEETPVHPGPPTAPSNSHEQVLNHRPDEIDIFVSELSFTVGKSPPPNGVPKPDGTGARGLGEGTPKSERPDGVFCDDIFGETPTGIHKSEREDSLRVERSGLNDNWDDAEGYYSYRFGELLDGRYEITAAHGKGVFSTVVRAKNIKAGNREPEEVAIKIIRSNDTMYKAGMTELVILKKLVGQDPEDKRHCVRFLSNFKYRNHLCLVFESLHMNLREVLKKFGRNIGLKLTAVRVYAKQLFIALKHLKNCGVLHCDIKPDNMLVNEAKNVLKLCDFGNAMFAGKNEITPYLVSRFYRAPEIILGLPYDHPLDIWSVGCCLYELYTGKVLFPGATNNDMLRLHMELKGPFPKKMLRKGGFTSQNFDQDLNFHSTEEDPVSKKIIKRVIHNIKPKDIGSIIAGSTGEDPKMLADFKDLLDKMFVLDPDKRLTVSQALSHPFITGK